MRLRSDGGSITVERIETTTPNQRVYNFEVEREHTYRVGDLHVWAHNVCGNSALSPNPQHVYEISRTNVATGSIDVFKYGISGTKTRLVNALGLSVRAERQVAALARAAGGKWTYSSSIIQSIPGGAGARGVALAAEKQFVYAYKALDGFKPVGNLFQ
jgi:hypothetical protein